MHILSEALKTHIAHNITTLATLWKITRQDGVIMGFTNHDQDIAYDGIIYQAGTGFEGSDLQNRDDLSVNNLEILSFFNSDAITISDLEKGLYDHARVDIYVVNYADLSEGHLQTMRGTLGQVSYGQYGYHFEMRGLSHHLETNIGRMVTPSCDAVLGNARCGVDLSALLVKSGLQLSDFDVTALENIIVEGFVLKNETSVRQAIDQLKMAYQFTLIEVDGKLKAKKYGDDAILSINNDDVIPIDTEPFENTRIDNTSLPYKLQVTALSRVRDYNQAAQLSVRQTVTANQLQTIELPLVLSDQKMKQLADTSLYRLWAERDQVHFMLPTKYGFLTPSDVIEFNGKRMRILSISKSNNLMLDITAISDDSELFDLSLFPAAANETVTAGTLLSDSTLYPLDLPQLPNDTDLSLYLAVSGESKSWNGATLYKSADDANFNVLTSTANQTVIGQILNQIPQGTIYGFDRSTEILLAIETGNLQSVTEQALLNGANSALIGDEIIQFAGAELIGTNYYRLTTLLRGRLGTEHETRNHAIGDRFLLLDNRLLKHNKSLDQVGITQFYKPVTFGQNISDIDSQPFTYQEKSLKPYSPVHIKGSRNLDGDLTINWIRRTRIGGA